MKHIGIVAVSAEGAALCYRTVCVEGTALFGRFNHPEVTMHTIALAEHMKRVAAGRWEDEASLLLESARKLVEAGAALFVCSDMSVCPPIAMIRSRPPAHWLHIAEEVPAATA